MRKLAVANQKGGVGKTTLAVNLAAGMASKYGERVLLIDMDAQANSTVQLIGDVEPEKSVFDFLMEGEPFESIVRNVSPCLDLLPASIDLALADTVLLAEIGGQTRLRARLAESDLSAYDVMIVDLPPSLALLCINGLAAVDEILVPITPGHFSQKGLRELGSTISKVQSNLGCAVRIAGLVCNMSDRTNASAEVRTQLADQFEYKVYEASIPRSTKFVELTSLPGENIFTYAPASHPAHIAFAALLAEVVSDG